MNANGIPTVVRTFSFSDLVRKKKLDEEVSKENERSIRLWERPALNLLEPNDETSCCFFDHNPVSFSFPTQEPRQVLCAVGALSRINHRSFEFLAECIGADFTWDVKKATFFVLGRIVLPNFLGEDGEESDQDNTLFKPKPGEFLEESLFLEAVCNDEDPIAFARERDAYHKRAESRACSRVSTYLDSEGFLRMSRPTKLVSNVKDDRQCYVGNQKAVNKAMEWLREKTRPDNTEHRPMILHGPSGCGKSLLVQMLAAQMDYELVLITALDASEMEEKKDGSSTSINQKMTLDAYDGMSDAKKRKKLESGNDKNSKRKDFAARTQGSSETHSNGKLLCWDGVDGFLGFTVKAKERRLEKQMPVIYVCEDAYNCNALKNVPKSNKDTPGAPLLVKMYPLSDWEVAKILKNAYFRAGSNCLPSQPTPSTCESVSKEYNNPRSALLELWWRTNLASRPINTSASRSMRPPELKCVEKKRLEAQEYANNIYKNPAFSRCLKSRFLGPCSEENEEDAFSNDGDRQETEAKRKERETCRKLLASPDAIFDITNTLLAGGLRSENAQSLLTFDELRLPPTLYANYLNHRSECYKPHETPDGRRACEPEHLEELCALSEAFSTSDVLYNLNFGGEHHPELTYRKNETDCMMVGWTFARFSPPMVHAKLSTKISYGNENLGNSTMRTSIENLLACEIKACSRALKEPIPTVDHMLLTSQETFLHEVFPFVEKMVLFNWISEKPIRNSKKKNCDEDDAKTESDAVEKEEVTKKKVRTEKRKNAMPCYPFSSVLAGARQRTHSCETTLKAMAAAPFMTEKDPRSDLLSVCLGQGFPHEETKTAFLELLKAWCSLRTEWKQFESSPSQSVVSQWWKKNYSQPAFVEFLTSHDKLHDSQRMLGCDRALKVSDVTLDLSSTDSNPTPTPVLMPPPPIPKGRGRKRQKTEPSPQANTLRIQTWAVQPNVSPVTPKGNVPTRDPFAAVKSTTISFPKGGIQKACVS